MGKIFTALGLMSGTSMDGVDASIIQTDGEANYKAISNKYFEYKKDLYENLISLREKINSSKDLKKFENELKFLEKEITLFHAKAVNNLINDTNIDIDFVGFHGQTIFHNAIEKITVQLGDGKLLSQLTKKAVVYDFRQNDLKNGGEGAPLAPIFHELLAKKFNLTDQSTQAIFVNIGGIANLTRLTNDYAIGSWDCGPGMCLIDKWIRVNSKNKIDEDGKIAKTGIVNKKILNEYMNRIDYFWHGAAKKSFDINDFDINFVRGLSLADGAATLIEFTAMNILSQVETLVSETTNLILCGGGRKNKFLVKRIEKLMTDYFKITYIHLKIIDDYGIDGDFVESQAFGYLAIRSYLGLPISYPPTTGCKEPCTGGVIVKNY